MNQDQAEVHGYSDWSSAFGTRLQGKLVRALHCELPKLEGPKIDPKIAGLLL